MDKNNNSLHLGFDVGGTDTKFGVVDSDANIIFKGKMPTIVDGVGIEMIEKLSEKTKEILKSYSVSTVGIGLPGGIDRKTLTFKSGNLRLDKFPVYDELSKRIDLPFYIENDANCAAFGEVIGGAAKGKNNVVVVTLGTGIGGGVITDKRIYGGADGYAGEVGHMSINADGIPCHCGNIGCWERYCSVTALKAMVADAVEKNPTSIIAKKAKIEGITGKTVFDAMEDNCIIAKEVYDKYSYYMCIGLKNIIYIFNPDMIVLAGGITAQGDKLLNPIYEKLKTDTPIVISKLQNDAGIVGASLLYKNK